MAAAATRYVNGELNFHHRRNHLFVSVVPLTHGIPQTNSTGAGAGSKKWVLNFACLTDGVQNRIKTVRYPRWFISFFYVVASIAF